MEGLGVPLLVLGGLLIVFALVRSGRGPGRMPGDVAVSRGPVRVWAPLGTSLLVSILLTVALNLAFCAPR